MSKLLLALDPQDLERLRRAARDLEHPSLTACLSSRVGTPIENPTRLLPGPLFQ